MVTKLACMLLLVATIEFAMAQQPEPNFPPPGGFVGKPTLAQLVGRYRNSVLRLRVEIVDKKNGAVTDAYATGFVISDQGHVLTAAHFLNGVDRYATVYGHVASKFSAADELEIISHDTTQDAALLKFKSSAIVRIPIPIGSPKYVSDASTLYVMGFPMSEEWFYDTGTLTGKGGPLGSWTTTMSFEPGISGGPIFNADGEVVAMVWGGVPGSEGTLNRILPVNLLSTQIEKSGSKISSDPPWSQLSPREQIEKRRRDGVFIRDGVPGFPMFNNGQTSILIASDGDYAVIMVTAPRYKEASLRVLPNQERRDSAGLERKYGIVSNHSCIAEREGSTEPFGLCGMFQTKSTVQVTRSKRADQVEYVTMVWRIPKAELGEKTRTASLGVVGESGELLSDGYHRIIW
jgi:S1-C subfamily serine protease